MRGFFLQRQGVLRQHARPTAKQWRRFVVPAAARGCLSSGCRNAGCGRWLPLHAIQSRVLGGRGFLPAMAAGYNRKQGAPRGRRDGSWAADACEEVLYRGCVVLHGSKRGAMHAAHQVVECTVVGTVWVARQWLVDNSRPGGWSCLWEGGWTFLCCAASCLCADRWYAVASYS